METKPAKLCTSCKHYSYSMGYQTCSYYKSLIDGSYGSFCIHARDPIGHCGREGRHHEQVELGAAERIVAVAICALIICVAILLASKAGA